MLSDVQEQPDAQRQKIEADQQKIIHWLNTGDHARFNDYRDYKWHPDGSLRRNPRTPGNLEIDNLDGWDAAERDLSEFFLKNIDMRRVRNLEHSKGFERSLYPTNVQLTNDQLKGLLDTGQTAAFNRYRQENKNAEIKLGTWDAAGKDLRWVNFSHMDITQVRNLHQAKSLDGIQLMGATITSIQRRQLHDAGVSTTTLKDCEVFDLVEIPGRPISYVQAQIERTPAPDRWPGP